jgi:hypothetical protein
MAMEGTSAKAIITPVVITARKPETTIAPARAPQTDDRGIVLSRHCTLVHKVWQTLIGSAVAR